MLGSRKARLALASATDPADYMLLDLQWKPSQCLRKKCPPSYTGNSFNIHGMWPNYFDGGHPEFCPSKYSYEVPSDLAKSLTQHWQSYKGDAAWLWRHEWTKHGTCLAKPLTCPEYLGRTVEAFLSLDVMDRLKAKQVEPGSVNVTNTQVLSAFETEVKTLCHSYHGTVYLSSLRVCYSNDWKPIDCPPQKSGNCKAPFELLKV